MATIIVGPTVWQYEDKFGEAAAVQIASLGDEVAGGYLICRNGGTAWLVAPSSSEVTRVWNSRNDANTTAQSITGKTGWFVPTLSQLQNPGYIRRTYWDSYTAASYWSGTETAFQDAGGVSFINGAFVSCNKGFNFPVRSFRTVTY